MDYNDHVEAVERELAAFVAAAADGDPSAAVPTCPEFSAASLATHIGQFGQYWTQKLHEGLDRPVPEFPERPQDEDLPQWVETIGRMLVSSLTGATPHTTCSNWFGINQNAAFAARRCAHELAIHRVDMQAARNTVEPVDAALAADGIEEIFALLKFRPAVKHLPEGEAAPTSTGQTLHLHGTDYDPSEWLLTLTPEGVEVKREHAKGDLALRGAVSDIEMLLYQRPLTGEVQRFGDESALDAWYAEFTFS